MVRSKRNLKPELESKVPGPSDCKQRKKEHNQRVQFRKATGDEVEDDDTIKSRANLTDDLNEVSATVVSTKAPLVTIVVWCLWNITERVNSPQQSITEIKNPSRVAPHIVVINDKIVSRVAAIQSNAVLFKSPSMFRRKSRHFVVSHPNAISRQIQSCERK